MQKSLARRAVLVGAAIASAALASSAVAQDKITLRLSSPASATDQRAVALEQVFAPAVADFAKFEGHWNASLFKQGTELVALQRDNLEMGNIAPQDISKQIPAWSILTSA